MNDNTIKALEYEINTSDSFIRASLLMEGNKAEQKWFWRFFLNNPIWRIRRKRNACFFFRLDEFDELPCFVHTLEKASDELSLYLRDAIGPEIIGSLTAASGGSMTIEQAAAALVDILNKQLQNDALYSDVRFSQVPLREETKRMLQTKNMHAEDRMLLNRYLLEDAYPMLRPDRDSGTEKGWVWLLGLLPVDNKFVLGDHEKVSRRVFRRLRLRYNQLNILTYLTWLQLKDKINETSDTPPSEGKEAASRYEKQEFLIYKHAITDLFVEKAITYLEMQAAKYKKWGLISYILGLLFISTAMYFSGVMYLHKSNIAFSDLTALVSGESKVGQRPAIVHEPLRILSVRDNHDEISMKRTITKDSANQSITIDSTYLHTNANPSKWNDVMEKFILAFTFYGFIVLTAVGLWRFGRAMLDQAERLLERRHALRQGRLFVHLHNGNLTIEDMEKAFNWNVSQPNAFSHMSTDAKAPWGAVLSEAIKVGAEVANSAKKGKGSEPENAKK